MKRLIFLQLCLIFFLFGNRIWAVEATVLVTSGIHLRESSNSNSKSLGIIPHHSKVEIIRRSDTFSTIDKLTDNWCSIQFAEKNGWVFCAYLGSFYRINTCQDGIKSYLPPRAQILKIVKSEKLANPPHFTVGDWRKTTTEYKSGFAYSETMMYEASRETYFLPEANLYEAYIIAKQCYITDKPWQELKITEGKVILNKSSNIHYWIRKTKQGVVIEVEFWA